MYNSTLIPHPEWGINPSLKSSSLFPAAFFSMEMANTELFSRMVSMEIWREEKLRVPYGNIRRGRLSDRQADAVIKAKERLQERGIYIDDTPALNPTTVKARLIKMINEYGIKEAYIDYIQLVTDDDRAKKTRAQQISDWYTELKNMAKLLGIPITILSQVDRQTKSSLR